MSFALRRLSDRALVSVSGPGSLNFLQSLCSQNVGAPLGRTVAAAFLSPKGKVLAECLMHPWKDGALLDLHAKISPNVLRMLLRHKMRQPFEIVEVPSLSVVAGSDHSSCKPDPRHASLPWRCIRPTTEVTALPDGVRDFAAARTKLCIPEGPAEIPPDSQYPFHVNLDLINAVVFNKGCFVGQELTTRTMRRGVVKRRLVVVETEHIDDGRISPGTDIFVGEAQKPLGKLISWIPAEKIGLAQISAPPGTDDPRLNSLEMIRAKLGFLEGEGVKVGNSRIKGKVRLPDGGGGEK